MKVFLNNNEINLKQETNLIMLLEIKSINNPKGIALAVNNKVIPKKEWDNYFLNDGDKVVLIQAACGG